MGSKNNNCRNIKHLNIFKINSKCICLLCMTSLNDGEYSSLGADEVVSVHFRSETHKEKTKSLMKICITDPLVYSKDSKYANVVSSCIFDISLALRNGQSYVLEYSDCIFCSLCQLELFKTDVTDKTLEEKLFLHLASEPHMKNLKNSICWIYYFSEDRDFVMISQTVVYCSLCKQTVKSTDDTLLEALVCHVRSEHDHHTERRVVDDFEESGVLDEEIVSSHHEVVNNMNYDSTDIDKNGLLLLDSDSSDSDNEAYKSCSNSSGSEHFEDPKEPLKCPDCCEFIEIYNENEEFSLQLHNQKHRDLKALNDNCDFEFNAHIDYVCQVCKEIIPIFNRNLEFSVSRHEGLGCKKGVEDQSDLIDFAICKLPENIKKFKKFFALEGNKIVCKLCNCAIHDVHEHNNVAVTIQEHLINTYHEGQLKSLAQDLAMVVSDSKNVEFPSTHEEIEHKITCCGTSFTEETYTPQNVFQNKTNVNHEPNQNHKLNVSKPTNQKKNPNIYADDYHLENNLSKCSETKTLVGNLTVHREFLTVNDNSVTCNLCSKNSRLWEYSVTFKVSNIHYHVTEYSHKREFLAELKRIIGSHLNPEIKFLIFVNNQLYCTQCRCYISPWSTFYTICQSVITHLGTHRTTVVSLNHAANLSKQLPDRLLSSEYALVGVAVPSPIVQDQTPDLKFKSSELNDQMYSPATQILSSSVTDALSNDSH